ncbi:MAG: hypothetical protein J7L58_07250, partial [Thermoplasmata archaeon]|nr:hypothetical protein [Thermoplasmata archaeon]
FMAITILLLTSFIPVGNSIATKENETKTMEVPVKIYTLQGIKEIRKELPVNEAMKLMHLFNEMFNETRNAIKLSVNPEASFIERAKANALIDSFLYEMRRNGLLGDLSIKEARELITGKYFQKEKNSMEARKIMFISKLLNQNGWQVNALCYLNAGGNIINVHPWNFIPILLINLISNVAFSLVEKHEFIATFLLLTAVISSFGISLMESIPHLTTVGFWLIAQGGMPYSPPPGWCGWLHTYGLFGKKGMDLKNQRRTDNCNYSWIHWYRAAIAIHKNCLWFFIVHSLQENVKYYFILHAMQMLFSPPFSIFHTYTAFSSPPF